MKNPVMNAFLDYLGERRIHYTADDLTVRVGGFSAEYRPEAVYGVIKYPERVLVVGKNSDGEFGTVDCCLEKLIECFEKYLSRVH